MHKKSKHSLSSSTAKQKYSFGKANRFTPYKAPTDVAYLPNSKSNHKSAIMGYGQRSLINDECYAKYPHAYDIPSAFGNKKGNAFKSGRHVYIKLYKQIDGPRSHIKYTKQIPGPGYQLPTTLDSRSASIKSRQFDNTIALKEYIPGPGLYEIPSSIDNGKNSVFESQYRSGGSPKMVTKEEGEPYVRKTRIPGPGEYELDKYGLSNKKIVGEASNTKFGSSKRNSFIKVSDQALKNPGPGEYKIPSEFDN